MKMIGYHYQFKFHCTILRYINVYVEVTNSLAMCWRRLVLAGGGREGREGDSSEGKDEGGSSNWLAHGWGYYRLMLNATFIEVRRISGLKY